MPRIKERIKFIHEPSTHEIFRCLSDMPVYSKILLENKPKEPYSNFLRWLIAANFYNDKKEDEKISIKRLATDFKSDSTKITKWINEIYQAIFDHNNDKPEQFQGNGVKVLLQIKETDNYCNFNTSLSTIPREYESFSFYFVHAKVGTDQFWVKTVQHVIEENTTAIYIRLEGGYVNKYREYALDKALFHGKIGMMDAFKKSNYEIDIEIKDIYRH